MTHSISRIITCFRWIFTFFFWVPSLLFIRWRTVNIHKLCYVFHDFFDEKILRKIVSSHRWMFEEPFREMVFSSTGFSCRILHQVLGSSEIICVIRSLGKNAPIFYIYPQARLESYIKYTPAFVASVIELLFA